jgi:hypothetical protein
LNRALARNHRFSFVVEFFAHNAGSHRFCAYVVSKRSGKTLARAETTWRNTAPVVQPAPVGSGECPAKRFPDNSVYAQVAIAEVGCEVLESVAYGADAASGAATAEGAGSAWANAWTGTYYAYSCISGSQLAAFNWGRQYAYAPTSTVPLVKPES